ncbi:MAG TPA: MFS transporter [Motiliproteus sp.]
MQERLLARWFINRHVMLLALCQALLVSGNILLVSVTALIGQQLALAPALATLPVAIQFAGMMAATLPASLLMKRIGRRRGFVLGNLIGIAGALVAIQGLRSSSFVLFCCGTFLLGCCIGISQLYRFAAVDASPPEQKHRAISWVMSGGLLAALIGPNLAIWTRDWLPQQLFVGSFVGLLGLYLLALALLGVIRVPPPSQEEVQGEERPLRRVVCQPSFVLAVVAAMVAYAVMALIMTATPLAMQGCGHGFAATAGVIQWHVLGMFAPSFVTGRLIQRFGTSTVMLVGAALTLACILINLQGVSEGHFLAALTLLGVGWNFLYIGATGLLTETYRPAEKARVQGLNDVLVSIAVMLATVGAGMLQNLLGWSLLNQLMLAPLLLVGVALLWFERVRGEPALDLGVIKKT